MNKPFMKIGEAAKRLKCSPSALRYWESTGDLIPEKKSKGGTRYYTAEQLDKFFGNKHESKMQD